MATTFLNVLNEVQVQLDPGGVGVTDASATFTLKTNDGSNLPTGRFALTFDDEIVVFSSRAADVCTVEQRGADGTSAAPHDPGAFGYMNVIALSITELNAAVNVVEGTALTDRNYFNDTTADFAAAWKRLVQIDMSGRAQWSGVDLEITLNAQSYNTAHAGQAKAYVFLSDDGALTDVNERISVSGPRNDLNIRLVDLGSDLYEVQGYGNSQCSTQISWSTFGSGITVDATNHGAAAASGTTISDVGITYKISSGVVRVEPTTGNASLQLDGAAATDREVAGYTAGVRRWRLILGSTAAESGGSVGSDLLIQARTDSDGLIDNPVDIQRESAGLMTLGGSTARPLSLTGSLTTAGIVTTPNIKLWLDASSQNGIDGVGDRNMSIRSLGTNRSLFLSGSGTGSVRFNWFQGVTHGGVWFDDGAGTAVGTISNSGACVFGVAGVDRGSLTLRHGAGGNTASYLALYSRNGTLYYLWFEDDGTLKTSTTAPVNNADGSEIGTQT